jgi:hypothetical protein
MSASKAIPTIATWHRQLKPAWNPLEAATLIGEPSHAMFTLRRRWVLTYMSATSDFAHAQSAFDQPFGDERP